MKTIVAFLMSIVLPMTASLLVMTTGLQWHAVATTEQLQRSKPYVFKLNTQNYVLHYNQNYDQWYAFSKNTTKSYPIVEKGDIIFMWPDNNSECFYDCSLVKPSVLKDIDGLEMYLKRPRRTTMLKTKTLIKHNCADRYIMKLLQSIDFCVVYTSQKEFQAVGINHNSRTTVSYRRPGHLVIRTQLDDNAQYVQSYYVSPRTNYSCFIIRQTVLIGTRAQNFISWWRHHRQDIFKGSAAQKTYNHQCLSEWLEDSNTLCFRER
jgi:hypothetical protein